jgi:SAM-dependent methyltransferase
VVGDLQAAPHVPDGSFDTIICTHVLCSLERPGAAVGEIRRLLAPGGLVLCTNPVVLQAYAPHPVDCWRFTRDSMAFLFSEGFARVELHSYGNAATVAGSPYYLMDEHFPRRVLEHHDARAPSVVAAAAWKA